MITFGLGHLRLGEQLALAVELCFVCRRTGLAGTFLNTTTQSRQATVQEVQGTALDGAGFAGCLFQFDQLFGQSHLITFTHEWVGTCGHTLWSLTTGVVTGSFHRRCCLGIARMFFQVAGKLHSLVFTSPDHRFVSGGLVFLGSVVAFELSHLFESLY
ncbi:hypothetical protein D3C71_1630920 [compost metagenome]